jgi:hypothetical protein
VAGSGNLTSNANQFLGVPFSIKAAPQITNTTTFGAFTNINAGNFFGYEINSSGAADSKIWRHKISGTDLTGELLSDDGLTSLIYDTVTRSQTNGAYRTYDYTSNIFNGPIYAKNILVDVNNSAGTAAQILTSTGTGAAWSNAPAVGAGTNNVVIEIDTQGITTTRAVNVATFTSLLNKS